MQNRRKENYFSKSKILNNHARLLGMSKFALFLVTLALSKCGIVSLKRKKLQCFHVFSSEIYCNFSPNFLSAVRKDSCYTVEQQLKVQVKFQF